MLASLGITEESAGCAIRSDIDAVAIERCHTGVGKMLDVHFDRHEADANAVEATPQPPR